MYELLKCSVLYRLTSAKGDMRKTSALGPKHTHYCTEDTPSLQYRVFMINRCEQSLADPIICLFVSSFNFHGGHDGWLVLVTA